MAYATQSDVQDAIGLEVLKMIADDDGNGTVDAAVVSKALDDASSIVESYTGTITTVTAAIRRVTIDIGVELMRRARDKSTDDSKAAYEAAIAWLRDVAKGVVALVPTTPDEETVDAGDPDYESEERIWTRSTAGCF